MAKEFTDGTTTSMQPDKGRRKVLRSLGLSAAGAAVFSAAGFSLNTANAAGVTDADILTFALNLEYLEAEYYLRAATGAGLTSTDTGGGGPVLAPSTTKVDFSSDPLVGVYATEIAQEEQKHVQFLRAALTALTGSVIPEPEIDLVNSFAALGSLAGLGSGFNPFANPDAFLLGAYIFEDVGVTAYHGAAPLIANKVILDKAAGILAVEAYHAGLVRTVLFANGDTAFSTTTLAKATTAISKLRAQLDQTYGTPNQDDFGVGSSSVPVGQPGGPMIVNASNAMNGSLLGGFPSNMPPGNNAIAFDRTTRQVLNIVYGGVNATAGLFFPKALNGTIK
jgi:Ferritin-like domain